jgi:hypothetical protein
MMRTALTILAATLAVGCGTTRIDAPIEKSPPKVPKVPVTIIERSMTACYRPAKLPEPSKPSFRGDDGPVYDFTH